MKRKKEGERRIRNKEGRMEESEAEHSAYICKLALASRKEGSEGLPLRDEGLITKQCEVTNFLRASLLSRTGAKTSKGFFFKEQALEINGYCHYQREERV